MAYSKRFRTGGPRYAKQAEKDTLWRRVLRQKDIALKAAKKYDVRGHLIAKEKAQKASGIWRRRNIKGRSNPVSLKFW